MAKQPKMICTLDRPIVTDDGDFIPKGTPVQVLQWGTDSFAKEQVVEVRPMIHMYADYQGSLPESFNGFCGTGLLITVDVNDLTFAGRLSYPMNEGSTL